MNNIFPWCEEIWGNLISSIQKNRLPHAILFYGNDGLGKSELAQQLAQYLLCSDPKKEGRACQVCKDCTLFSAKTHGDLYYLLPENNKAIGVDEIRQITLEASKKPQRNGVKVFVIKQADKMSIAASNALLKTLEEPPGASIFLLTSERKFFLSSTILSRCQHVAFSTPSSQKTEQWLLSDTQQKYSKEAITAAITWSLGAPLLARQLLENNRVAEYQLYITPLLAFFSEEGSVFLLSKAWGGKPLVDIIYVAQITCYYLLTGQWAANFNRPLVYQWSKKIIELKKMTSTGIALNEALMLDFLLAE